MKHLAQRGATLIEFALGLLIFLMFLLGVVDFSRLLYSWAAANEATRAGARYAVVCADPQYANSKNLVLGQMTPWLPQLTASNIAIDWYDPAGNKSTTCDSTSCGGVRVRIDPQNPLKFQWIAPIVGSAIQQIPMPEFSTYLPREILRQDPNSSTACAS
ncbi:MULTISPECIES: TadE/TadG family type IV pilus assembly protein [Comamonas]|uniref:TadE/TadG family type IV pilus assembly protein n=1 Tax=Comamonas TaxID=283 RepID=UPI0005102592|nr:MULTISPECIES: TadE/TadG family type IV pilus assembly protein [Comamonas]KGG91869.1 pilus assembly protein TadE [Comamonas thiooxydans]KGG95376.1 pilus assembly protein TadE [Comamonas thiooxydans]KGH07948.1 pilus assembly protein TadE [Comamonas thiooxydans]KGH15477.1 pilus assembly protein TadE [Comamonas thiooxydans]TZG07217.1 pilus assembly protein [Comamonas thiooxydans]